MQAAEFRHWCRAAVSRTAPGWCGEHIDIDGELIHCVAAGQGQPVILLHGFLEWSYTWRHNLPILAERARVVAVDLRGFGLTLCSDRGGYSLGEQAEVICRLMDALGIDQAVLVGHSMGGEVAWRLGLRHPDRVRGLVLVAASGYLKRRRSLLEHCILQLPLVNRLAVRAAFMNRRFATRALQTAYRSPGCWNPADVDAYLLPARVPGAAARTVRLIGELDLGQELHRLPEVSQPALLVWGAEDPVIPLEHARRMNRELPASQLVVFPDCGHSPHEEYPVLFNREVICFLERLQQDEVLPSDAPQPGVVQAETATPPVSG